MVVELNLNVEERGAEVTQYELSLSTDGLSYSVVESYDGIPP